MLVAVTQTVHVSTTLLDLLAGVLIPAAVALVTKQKAPDPVKFSTLTLLSIIGGVAANLVAAGGTFVWQQTLESIGVAFVTALASHYGLSASGAQRLCTEKA